jgi:hypothetical protein
VEKRENRKEGRREREKCVRFFFPPGNDIFNDDDDS